MPIDYRNYPPDWNLIRIRIMNRANHVCERCDAPNGSLIVRRKDDLSEWIPLSEWKVRPLHIQDLYRRPVRVVLTIAHLNHDTTDNRDENLAALCQRCHLTHDARLHAEHAGQTRQQRRIDARAKAGQLDLL